MNFEKINKIVLVSISTVITILLFVSSIAAFFVIPDYANLFSELGTKVPAKTEMVLSYYKYCLILPIACSIASFYLMKSSKVKYQYLLFSIPTLLLIIGVLFFSMTIYSLYLPVTQGV